MSHRLVRLSAMLRALFSRHGGSNIKNTSGSSESAVDSCWLERGLKHRRSGERDEALECFRRAIEIRHDDVEALVNQGELELDMGRREDAADSFELALAFAPECAGAALGLGRLACELGDRDRALPHLQRAARCRPHDPEPWFELGRCYSRAGDTQAALSFYLRALESQPHHVGACVNLGLIYLAQRGDANRAQRLFERAIALRPELVAAQANLGLALQEQGQFDAALAHYKRLIDAHPDIVEYRWNRGLALLSRGDFANGWTDYELRNARGGKGGRRFPFAVWDGSELTGRSMLVYGEQGIGDEIMFASCIPDVLRRSSATVIECDQRLTALFQRSFPSVHVHGGQRDGERDWLQAFPRLDTQIASASLPRFLRRQWSDFPSHNAYLVADPARVTHWKSRLAFLGGGVKAGICWRGGTPKTRQSARSLTVEQCMPLMTARGCRFVCMQHDASSGELETLRQQGIEIQWWPEVMGDFDELAAIIVALDVMIAVPSSVAHLSGALGRPVWLLLSATPEWRYLWQGERMPWYPSANLYRQRDPGHWDGVILELQQRLSSM